MNRMDEKADGNTEKEAEGSEAGTDDNMTEKDSLKQEKLQICYVHVCGAVKSPGVYELTRTVVCMKLFRWLEDLRMRQQVRL